MHKNVKPTKQDKKTFITISIIFFCVCLIVSLSCFQYYRRLQLTLKSESDGYMAEITSQIANNVNRTITNKYSMLGTVASVLEKTNADTFSKFEEISLEERKIWNYQKLMLIDVQGVAYDENGESIALRNDENLQDLILNKNRSLSTTQIIDGKESVVFAIPLTKFKLGEISVCALAASYELSTFDTLLSMSAFDGKCYAHIIRRDGTIVVRSSSEFAIQTGYNVLNSIGMGEMFGSSTIDNIKQDILSGVSGQAEFMLGGKNEYMVYTPLVLKDWSLLTFVPVEVVNAKSHMMLNITLLLCTLIGITFSLLLVFIMLNFYRHKRKLEKIAYVDPITSGHTIERFYEIAQELIDKNDKINYAIIYINIEKFKVLNEQFGKKSCDQILQGISNGVQTNLDESECLGHIGADNFSALVEYSDISKLSERFCIWNKSCVKYLEDQGGSWLPLTIEFGIYPITKGENISLALMIDRAKLSLSEGVNSFIGKLHYALYDEHMRETLLRDKKLEDLMENALENNEFQVYLQPKYNTQTETIGGAEALVRWQSHEEGMIFPDEFIPLFEKNGFVIDLDFYVFECVCKTLREWIDEGLLPVKISVNCSRLHLKSTEFLNKYCEIADKYDIPHLLVEIELTENTVFEDIEYLCNIITQIHETGFGCSMDDFGSGYSSLNLIKDIPVDTIKLDRIFFKETNGNSKRSESVIGSIVSMSKALNLQTVAEGVEERAQVDMLKRLGCDYIQGYYFARPMPIEQFKKLAFYNTTNE